MVDFAGSRTLSVYYSGYRTSKLKVLARACHELRSPNARHSSSTLHYAAQFSLYQECNYIYRTSCRKSLPARILRVIASCVNSNHVPQTNSSHHCNVNDIDTNHERSTSTRMERAVRGYIKHFMKTGRVLQAISCPACRAHHGVH